LRDEWHSLVSKLRHDKFISTKHGRTVKIENTLAYIGTIRKFLCVLQVLSNVPINLARYKLYKTKAKETKAKGTSTILYNFTFSGTMANRISPLQIPSYYLPCIMYGMNDNNTDVRVVFNSQFVDFIIKYYYTKNNFIKVVKYLPVDLVKIVYEYTISSLIKWNKIKCIAQF